MRKETESERGRETERGTKPGVAADGAVGVLPGAAVGAVERVL